MEIDGVSISDIHLGHPRVPVDLIMTNLDTYFFPMLVRAVIAFFCGDIFHQLLRIDAVPTQETLALINKILIIAKEHNIKLRVLRGTFTHDRAQNKLFTTLNQPIGADLKCIDTVSLEYMEDFDLRILYIPDNLPYVDSESCISEIRTMMQNVQWDYVDFCVMHGYFEHVLPEGIPTKPHCTFHKDQFQDIVRYAVFTGHVHTPSTNGKVVYNGSFDRLAHGEEEKKGFVSFKLKDSKFTKTFIENKDAMPFVTITPRGNSIDELLVDAYDQISEKCTNPPFGHIRVIHEDPENRQLVVQHIAHAYGSNVSVIGVSKKTQTTEMVTPEDTDFQKYEQIVPTLENLAELVFTHMQKINLNPDLSLGQVSGCLESLGFNGNS